MQALDCLSAWIRFVAKHIIMGTRLVVAAVLVQRMMANIS